MNKYELMKYVQSSLFNMQDLEYKDFQSNLMPEIAKDKVIGVRTPELRKFAKEFAKTDMSVAFLDSLPHEYYEENNLHAFIIEQIKDYDTCIERLNEFLPYVDNWATCDSMKPKVFSKNIDKLRAQAYKWIDGKDTYTIRFGIEVLHNYFLNEQFSTKDLKKVSIIRSDEYYINMMIAWYFATALTKQYESTLPFIEKNTLDTWTHNKAIQKAIESRVIPQENKEYLKTLKIKNKK